MDDCYCCRQVGGSRSWSNKIYVCNMGAVLSSRYFLFIWVFSLHESTTAFYPHCHASRKIILLVSLVLIYNRLCFQTIAWHLFKTYQDARGSTTLLAYNPCRSPPSSPPLNRLDVILAPLLLDNFCPDRLGISVIVLIRGHP